ncbi:MAG: phosphoglucosamine mutase, partial [Candidatus Zixiibacteriota bacterium]
KVGFMQGMRQHIMEKVRDVRDVLEVDGIRINRNDGSWVLARVSGTEPKARVVVEARSVEQLEQLKSVALEGVRRFLK